MQALFFARLIATLLESFRLYINYIARYALLRNAKNLLKKNHKPFAKQFIEVHLNKKKLPKQDNFL